MPRRFWVYGLICLGLACADSSKASAPTQRRHEAENRDAEVDGSSGRDPAADAGAHDSAVRDAAVKARDAGAPAGLTDSSSGDGDSASGKGDGACFGPIAVQATYSIPTVWLVIDGSASVADPNIPTTRWAWLRSTLLDPSNGLVKLHETHVRWGLMVYSGADLVTGTIPDAGPQDCPKLITLDPARDNFDAITQAYPVEALGGTSPAHLALEYLLERIQQPGASHIAGPTQIVLLSDGASNDLCERDPASGGLTDPTPRMIEAARKLRASGALVSALALGNDPRAVSNLEEVAAAGGGEVRIILNAQQLRSALESIADFTASPCDLVLQGRANTADQCPAEVSIGADRVACDAKDGWALVHPHLVRLNGQACTRFLQQQSPAAELTFACGKYLAAPDTDECAPGAQCECDAKTVAGAWASDSSATVLALIGRHSADKISRSVDMLREAFTRSALDLRVGSLFFPSAEPAPCTCVTENPQHWIPGPGACCLNAANGGACYVSPFGSSDQIGFASATEWFAMVPSVSIVAASVSPLDTVVKEAEKAWSMIDTSERLATILFTSTASACESESSHYQRLAREVDGTVPTYIVGSNSDPTGQAALSELAGWAGTGMPLLDTDGARLGDSLARLAAMKDGRCRFHFAEPISYNHLHLVGMAANGTAYEIPHARGRERGYWLDEQSGVLTETLCADILAGTISDLRFETGCLTGLSKLPM